MDARFVNRDLSSSFDMAQYTLERGIPVAFDMRIYSPPSLLYGFES